MTEETIDLGLGIVAEIWRDLDCTWAELWHYTITSHNIDDPDLFEGSAPSLDCARFCARLALFWFLENQERGSN